MPNKIFVMMQMVQQGGSAAELPHRVLEGFVVGKRDEMCEGRVPRIWVIVRVTVQVLDIVVDAH